MSSGETVNDVPVNEGLVAAWEAEAEAGYDVSALKRRGRGRPGRGAEPAEVVALRLTADELAALDARAAREHRSRSELIREAMFVARRLSVPTPSIDPADASAHFGWLGAFIGHDNPASNTLTRERMSWTPTGPTLLQDLSDGHWFKD